MIDSNSENDTENEEEALYEHFAFVVDKGQSPTRIDKFLCYRIEKISRNRIQSTLAHHHSWI